MNISHFEMRTTVDGFPLALRFKDEYEMMDFADGLDQEFEAEIVLVVNYASNEVKKLGG